MAEYDNTNRGVLFLNDRQSNDKRPGYKGKVNVAGVEYRISGWVKKNDDNTFKLMSLQVEPVEEAAKAVPKSVAAPKPVADPAFDDDLPF
jgi:hypothetical protein